MEEKWKDIYGFEGLYQISNLGRVKSLQPYHGTTERILTPAQEKDGYLFVYLCKNGKKKHCKIHRLVAIHFVPNDNLFFNVINHKDFNPQNNVWTNLEWCDQQYNVDYSASKQVNQYDLKGNYIRTFKSTMDVKRQLGFDNSVISKCCLGKRRQANGFIWRYQKEQEN